MLSLVDHESSFRGKGMPDLSHMNRLYQRMYSRTSIPKTCLYNFDPLKPHFYIVKLGHKNIDYGYSLEPPCRKVSVFGVEIFYIFE